MTRYRSLAATAALLTLLAPLSGCLSHTYRVQQPKMPSTVKTATAEQLLDAFNAQGNAVHTLKATVTFQVSVGGADKGKVTDYTSFSGYIRLQTPGMVRVLGLLPVVHTQAFDLASDGERFTLVVPHNNKAYVGPNTLTTPSKNAIENLRPGIFFDTMLPHPVQPDDLVYLSEETQTTTDPRTHEVTAHPEYDLTTLRRKANSQELVPERRIHFDRTTLLPTAIDLYNGSGSIETQAVYGPYESFGSVRYPATITITRPIDEYRIVLSVEKLTQNETLPENQFQLKVPDGYTTEQLH